MSVAGAQNLGRVPRESWLGAVRAVLERRDGAVQEFLELVPFVRGEVGAEVALDALCGVVGVSHWPCPWSF